MDKEKRRLVAGIGAGIAGLVVALLGWLFFFRAAPEAPAEAPAFPQPQERSIALFERKGGEGEDTGLVAPVEPQERELVLLQLWDKPISALSFARGPRGGVRVRFVERESGDIYETGASRLTTRIYNTATPASQRGWFGEQGGALALQFLPDDAGTISTFEGPLEPLAEPDPDTGSFVSFASAPLPRNIVSFAYDPTGAPRFAYLEALPQGGARLVVQRRGEAGREIWSSTVRSWHISWPLPEGILLVANTQPHEDGVALLVNPQTGAQRVVAAANTLNAVLSPSGKLLAYSARRGRNMHLFVRDLEGGMEVDTGVSTIAEKCAWTRREEKEVLLCAVPRTGVIPDNIIFWYQGGGYFDDVFVLITDPKEGGRVILDPQERYNTRLDVARATAAPDGSSLLVFDKRTLTPWLVLLDPLLREQGTEESDATEAQTPAATSTQSREDPTPSARDGQEGGVEE